MLQAGGEIQEGRRCLPAASQAARLPPPPACLLSPACPSAAWMITWAPMDAAPYFLNAARPR